MPLKVEFIFYPKKGEMSYAPVICCLSVVRVNFANISWDKNEFLRIGLLFLMSISYQHSLI